MFNDSKKISKTDDASKKFIMECLGNENTYGFDIDSIYFVESQWYLFEYLKCEHERMTPHTSNPKYYPWNYKKFLSLFKIKEQLNGRLFLINYSDREKDGNLVKIMEVISIDKKKIEDYINATNKPSQLEYLITKDTKMTKEEFSKWLKDINSRAREKY